MNETLRTDIWNAIVYFVFWNNRFWCKAKLGWTLLDSPETRYNLAETQIWVVNLGELVWQAARATPELMLALIELPLLRDEKIGKIGLLRRINCHLLTQATDLVTETSQQSRVDWTTELDRALCSAIIDLIFLRYKYSIFYRLEIRGRWNEAWPELGSKSYIVILLYTYM